MKALPYRALLRRLSRRLRGATADAHYFSKWASRFNSDDDVLNVFSIFENWATDFQGPSRRYGAATPPVSDRDARIARCNTAASVSGQRVLEIGPLEAGHTKQMLDLGATSVTAIESNPEAFLKCLLVKETLGLHGARFVFGDANAVIRRSLSAGNTFDVCCAVGVLYHMEDPLQMIELITRVAPVAYVWTHVASEQKPRGEWVELFDSERRSYRARYNYYGRTAHYGGIGARAAWLTDASLLDAFQNRGHVVQVLEREPHPHGDAILFVSKKT